MYTNSGFALLALAANAVHKLWKWPKNERNPTGKATATTVPQLWQPASGILMTNDIRDANPEDGVACFALSKNDSYLTWYVDGKNLKHHLVRVRLLVEFCLKHHLVHLDQRPYVLFDRLLGGILIIGGLYTVLWGKEEEKKKASHLVPEVTEVALSGSSRGGGRGGSAGEKDLEPSEIREEARNSHTLACTCHVITGLMIESSFPTRIPSLDSPSDSCSQSTHPEEQWSDVSCKDMSGDRATLQWRRLPGLDPNGDTKPDQCNTKFFTAACNGGVGGGRGDFACISVTEKREGKDFSPTLAQLFKHPLAIFSLIPKDAGLFAAGAVSGAAAKTVTAPLDRIKLLMQTHGLRAGQEGGKTGIGFVEALTLIGKEEGIKGYWKGNLPQVIRIIPYSAVQLFAYETYKKLFQGKDGELSVLGRLAAGACAGMTSTFV
ncbi:putative envelope ADP,ATP carrier protein, chloroplastic [Dorcoceras hygrometricum]|uniref:Putative envelope ADP,ATP carrier protein, chloroplastic n=1 Tax=Dorcoceras hygrometricum TaxID=472368 RepID=A0A2Z7C2B7_9LAMI|nr:putative envelope ADP,ATP carrier protein, chloroplastic [Dorcoceras hygrometricum]